MAATNENQEISPPQANFLPLLLEDPQENPLGISRIEGRLLEVVRGASCNLARFETDCCLYALILPTSIDLRSMVGKRVAVVRLDGYHARLVD